MDQMSDLQTEVERNTRPLDRHVFFYALFGLAFANTQKLYQYPQTYHIKELTVPFSRNECVYRVQYFL